jgi:hypothetical protein
MECIAIAKYNGKFCVIRGIPPVSNQECLEGISIINENLSIEDARIIADEMAKLHALPICDHEGFYHVS